MTRDEMLSMVIQRWGFEHENTIEFAQAMERMNDAELEAFMNEVLVRPFEEEEL